MWVFKISYWYIYTYICIYVHTHIHTNIKKPMGWQPLGLSQIYIYIYIFTLLRSKSNNECHQTTPGGWNGILFYKFILTIRCFVWLICCNYFYYESHGSRLWHLLKSTEVFILDDYIHMLNILRPRQNGRHFADDIFKCIFLTENVWISMNISLKFVPKVQINNSSIGSDNGLAPTRWQAIVRTNDA